MLTFLWADFCTRENNRVEHMHTHPIQPSVSRGTIIPAEVARAPRGYAFFKNCTKRTVPSNLSLTEFPDRMQMLVDNEGDRINK